MERPDQRLENYDFATELTDQGDEAVLALALEGMHWFP